MDCTQDYDSNQTDLWAIIDNFRETNQTILIMKDIPEAIRTNNTIIITKKCYNWNDLKVGTQKLISGKSVNFQRYNVTLNELTTSVRDIMNLFPLEILINEKGKIQLGKAFSSSFGYDESY